jgi:HPt (histidine-containing phosphotransfer) domain-containing protein
VRQRSLPIPQLSRSEREDSSTPGQPAVERRQPNLAGALRSDDRHGSEAAIRPKPLEAVLDQATIQQLRDTLTAEMRRQLIDIFDVQRERCVSELAEAVGRGDRGEIRRIAHMLEGSSASLGALALSTSCEALEHVCRSGDADVAQSQVAELRMVAAAASDALHQQLI